MVQLQNSTVFIRDTETVLSFDISLLGGLPVPTHGLGIIIFHTSTVFIRDTGIELSVGISLLGRLPVPSHGLGMVAQPTQPWLLE